MYLYVNMIVHRGVCIMPCKSINTFFTYIFGLHPQIIFYKNVQVWTNGKSVRRLKN